MRLWKPGTSLIGIIVRIFAMLLVIALIIWGAIFVISKIAGVDSSKETTTGTSVESGSTDGATGPSRNSKPSTSGSTQSSPAGQTSQTGHTSSTSTTTPNSQQLANSGPGEVIALFVGTATAGTVGYQLVLRKKQTI